MSDKKKNDETADPADEYGFEGEKGASGDKPWWQEAMRDMTLTGVASFFMSEDGIRRYLKEKNFPKELAGLFLDGVSRRKDDFYGLMAKEFGRVLGKIDLSREMEKFLEKHDVHLETKLSFERKKGLEDEDDEEEDK